MVAQVPKSQHPSHFPSPTSRRPHSVQVQSIGERRITRRVPWLLRCISPPRASHSEAREDCGAGGNQQDSSPRQSRCRGRVDGFGARLGRIARFPGTRFFFRDNSFRFGFVQAGPSYQTTVEPHPRAWAVYHHPFFLPSSHTLLEKPERSGASWNLEEDVCTKP